MFSIVASGIVLVATGVLVMSLNVLWRTAVKTTDQS